MKNIPYKQEYISELTNTAIKLLNDEYREQSSMIFKAPTGSGKTYMISQSLSRLVKEQTNNSYSFVWLSVNSLHENEIVFINWDSLIKKNNSFRLDNELDRNLKSVVQNTREEDREIILIIDESHRTAKAEKAKEVIEEINPTLIIEMTATPSNINGSLIDIPLAKVIAQGMIKSEVRINPSSKKIRENKDLLEVALKKRKEL